MEEGWGTEMVDEEEQEEEKEGGRKRWKKGEGTGRKVRGDK